MKLFTKNDLKTLKDNRDTPCVSIFIPTEHAGQDVQKSRIELKNQLGMAHEKLVHSGMRSPDADDILKPAKALIDDTMFWQYQSDGLAIFLSANVFQHFRVPIKLTTLVVVKRHFYVKPLVPLLGVESIYYVLATSQNHVRLIKCSEDGAEEVSVNEMPQSLEEALKYDDSEKHLHYHTNGHQKNGHNDSVYHGIGGGTDDNKNNILRYFRIIDNALQIYFKNDKTPFIMFAVDFLHPIYIDANSSDNYVKEGIKGNPDELSSKEIMNLSADYMKPYFQKGEEQALDRFGTYRAGGKTSVKLEDIIPAAMNGRVEALFIPEGLQHWGIYDEMNAKTMEAEENNPISEDLFELAAVHTLLTDGKVFVVKTDRMPQGAEIAAVLRY